MAPKEFEDWFGLFHVNMISIDKQFEVMMDLVLNYNRGAKVFSEDDVANFQLGLPFKDNSCTN